VNWILDDSRLSPTENSKTGKLDMDTHEHGDAENAGLENAGLENAGTSCLWVAKCNIINVRGHVRVNVTEGRGDPCTLQEAIQSGN